MANHYIPRKRARSPFSAPDPDLAAWPELPEAIKAGIVAMVKAAAGSGE